MISVGFKEDLGSLYTVIQIKDYQDCFGLLFIFFESKINKLFKQEKEDGPVCKFYEVIMDLGANNQFYNELTLAKDITLFAPSNEAWADFSVQNIIRLFTSLYFLRAFCVDVIATIMFGSDELLLG